MSENLKFKILETYRDRAFITSLVCGECSDFYSMIRSVINIPLIIGSSVLTILNSSEINKEDLKISNIIVMMKIRESLKKNIIITHLLK